MEGKGGGGVGREGGRVLRPSTSWRQMDQCLYDVSIYSAPITAVHKSL